MSSEDVGEAIMFVSYVSLVMAGINIIWGMFLLPWGILGFIFAAVDLFLFFYAKGARDAYLARNYEVARNRMRVVMFLGLIFGPVVIGIFARGPYRTLDDIITSRYLVKSKPAEIFSPPQFPKK